MANITAGIGRYDKYDPISGGFRAALAAKMDAIDAPFAVGLDSSGEVVVGSGVTGIIGVIAITKNMKAGAVVDIMTHGEMVEVANVAAAKVLTGNTTTGVIGDTAASATQTPIGFTVEATRLIVRKSVAAFDAVA